MKSPFQAILVLALLLISTSSLAGYENTNWGMSLEKIKSLYPGGKDEKQQNGETIYPLIRPFSGYSTSIFLFKFDEKLELKTLYVLFPKQGTNVEMPDLKFDPMSDKDAKVLFQNLTNKLSIKYGKPDSLSKKYNKIWSKGEDVITLTTIPGEKKGQLTVGLTYQKLPSPAELTKDL